MDNEGPPSATHPTSQQERKSATWFRINIIGTAVRRSLAPFLSDPDVLNIVTNIVSAVAWSYLLLSAIGTLGVDTKPLLSLFSIGGLTIGFSIKDLLSDSFAGLFVLFVRPFQRGDLVTVGGQKGRVVSVDIRYVKLMSEDERTEVLVPIASVYRSDIKIHR